VKIKFRATVFKKCNMLYFKRKLKLHQVGFIIKGKKWIITIHGLYPYG